MKKVLRGACALITAGMLATSTMAGLQVRLYDSFGDANGGEFDADSVGTTHPGLIRVCRTQESRIR